MVSGARIGRMRGIGMWCGDQCDDADHGYVFHFGIGADAAAVEHAQSGRHFGRGAGEEQGRIRKVML